MSSPAVIAVAAALVGGCLLGWLLWFDRG